MHKSQLPGKQTLRHRRVHDLFFAYRDSSDTGKLQSTTVLKILLKYNLHHSRVITLSVKDVVCGSHTLGILNGNGGREVTCIPNNT